jgi:hypothetical protein
VAPTGSCVGIHVRRKSRWRTLLRFAPQEVTTSLNVEESQLAFEYVTGPGDGLSLGLSVLGGYLSWKYQIPSVNNVSICASRMFQFIIPNTLVINAVILSAKYERV